MNPQRPPVTWPSCSWTTTWSRARPALAADARREAAAVEARVDRRSLDVAGVAVAGRRPPAALELDLERLEDVAGEGAGPRLELELGRA